LHTFQTDVKAGISEDKLIQKLKQFLEKVISTNKYFVAKELLSGEVNQLFQKFLAKAIKSGFLIRDESSNVHSTEKLATSNFRNGKDMRRRNPYLYHCNQLKYYVEEFDRFYLE
jgi:hypothetical protein